ncbi:MAG TPA: hypothetical protein VFK31_11395 [Rhodanobacteraceae bacterium]|nr:hypothetical protein [Rhodanobacteraceae bacterium]
MSKSWQHLLRQILALVGRGIAARDAPQAAQGFFKQLAELRFARLVGGLLHQRAFGV